MTRIGDRRKKDILAAASGCFARKGFHQTSVADICAAADMSPGSLYRYFRSKEEIIKAMAEDERREAVALVESLANHPDPIAGMQAMFGEALGSFADPDTNAMHAEVTSEALRNPAIAAGIRASDQDALKAMGDVIRQAQGSKAIDPTLDPDSTAEVLFALLDGLWWRQAMRPDGDPHRHDATVAVVLRRLLTPNPSA